MSERDEKKEPIKVVDRRSFTTDGRRRDSEDPAPPAPAPPPGGPARPVEDAAAPAPHHPPVKGEGFVMEPPPGESAQDPAAQDAAFVNLIVSLYQSGCFHLGITEEGVSPEAPHDLEAARASIEMLAALKRRTMGNLSSEESHILEALLAELQMAYVMRAPRA